MCAKNRAKFKEEEARRVSSGFLFSVTSLSAAVRQKEVVMDYH